MMVSVLYDMDDGGHGAKRVQESVTGMSLF